MTNASHTPPERRAGRLRGRAALRIPAPVLRRAEDLLLDCLASILAGASAPAVLAIERYAAAMGPADGPSEVLITRRRTTPLFAAMVNAAAARGRAG